MSNHTVAAYVQPQDSVPDTVIVTQTTTAVPSDRGLAKLRDPFPAHQISQLPKPTKKKEEMDRLDKATCAICGGYHAKTSIIHLSYVGHAALTDRLLDVDPLWNWEPMSYTAEGLPRFDATGGLWIRLTVCGLTRIGYGHAEGASYKDAGAREKEVIGDALRNAAMRFGAALDLWHKGTLHLPETTDDDTPDPSADDNAYLDWVCALEELAGKGLDPLMSAIKSPDTPEPWRARLRADAATWARLKGIAQNADKIAALKGKA